MPKRLKRKPAARRKPSASPARSTPRREPWPTRLAGLAVAAVVVVVPLAFWPGLRDPFRLPKLVLAGWLGLGSLVFLAWRLREIERVDLADLGKRAALRALLPLALVATLGLFTSAHSDHVATALADLWIGVACVVGWSFGFSAPRLRKLLERSWIPAVVLSLVAILQFHDLWEPLDFVGGQATTRYGVTSLAGNAGDLGAFLVLPCLLAQLALWQGRRRRWAAVALVASLYAVAATQTLTAIVALAAASALLWLFLLPRRRLPLLVGGGAVLALALVLSPAGGRIAERLDGGLDLNALLSGRLDGWRAAVWMLSEHPLAGVGHGAYSAVFSDAKGALLESGAAFTFRHVEPFFANAHNELLEAAAEWGWPGVAAWVWALVVVAGAVRSMGAGADGPAAMAGASAAGAERALAVAGLVAFALLALAHFPLRTALVAYPWLLFLAWIFRSGAEASPVQEDSP